MQDFRVQKIILLAWLSLLDLTYNAMIHPYVYKELDGVMAE